MKFRLYLLLPCLLLISCTPQIKEAADQSASAQADEVNDQPVRGTEPTDDDVMFNVFSGEYLGAEGDLEQAANYYLAAALESRDPAIAERATRISFAANAWAQAVMAADRWAYLDTENLDAHKLAAVAMLRVDDYSGAQLQLSEILRLMDGEAGNGWEVVAALLAGAYNPLKANDVLEQLIIEHPGDGNVDALYAQSQLSAHTQNVPKARLLAEQALALAPERDDLVLWLGRLAVNMGDLETALEQFALAWDKQPEDRDIGLAYAELLKREERYAEAEQVLGSLPFAMDIQFTRLVYAQESGNQPLALALYEEMAAYEAEDRFQHAYITGQAAELLELFPQAIDWYGRVTDGDQQLAATLRASYLIARTGDLPAARQKLRQLRETGNESAITESYLAESQILRDQDMDEEAYKLLTRSLDQLPGSVALRYSRAILSSEQGDIPQAEADFRKILEEEPENAATLNALGYTLADQTDRYEEALELIQQAYELNPDESTIIDSMGWVLYRLNRLDAALEYLERAWELDRNAEIAAHLGEVLWQTGDQDQARAVWQEAMELDSENAVLLRTLQRFTGE